MQDNLSLYHIFYTVARTGSISHSSRDLYISQPAISKAIQKLEQNLDTVLFKRSSRGVTLTPDGELLFEKVKEALSLLDEGENSIRHNRSRDIPKLRLGASSTLTRYVLSRLAGNCDTYMRKTISLVFLMYVSQFPASLLIRLCSFWMRKKSIWDSSDDRRSFGDIIFNLF